MVLKEIKDNLKYVCPTVFLISAEICQSNSDFSFSKGIKVNSQKLVFISTLINIF